MQAMNFHQSIESRFKILVWEKGKLVITKDESDAIRAHQVFEFAVDRYGASPVCRRVELYDRTNMIGRWSSEDG